MALLLSKGSCDYSTESQTLTADVCNKVRVYCRVPSKGVGDKPQICSNLAFELGVFLKKKKTEVGINHHLVTSLNHSCGSQDVSSLQFSSHLGDL